MKTFKAYLEKEILEAIRQYKYLVLFFGIIFFAISGPIMMKLLPAILKGQFHGDISSLFIVTRKSVIQNYIKDLFQIGLLFIVFTASGSLSDEISSQKLVFPFSKGSSPAGIVLAKVLHYCIIILLLTLLGFCINFYYTNLLFKNDSINFTNAIISGSLVSIYFIFNMILAIFFSSFIKRGVVAGFLTIGISYFSVLLSKIDLLSNFIPYRLIETSSSLTSFKDFKNLSIILLFSAVLILLTIFRMNRVEVV